MQITLTLELTNENLEKLKVFCQDTGATQTVAKTTAKTETAKPEAKQETAKAEAKQEPAQQTAPDKKGEEKKTEEKKALTLTDVRAVALKLSKSGKSALLKEIFAKFGAAKLSEVPKDKYTELMEELTNA